MLKINIVCVGNLKDKFFIDASEEYSKRLSRFCNLNIIEVKEYTNSTDEKEREQEGQEILKHAKGYLILCDIFAEQFSSEKFAQKLQNISNMSSEITFIIGGSVGVSDEVKNAVNEKMSVSKMTFPHRLFRIMLLEQIYRAQTILCGIKYHK